MQTNPYAAPKAAVADEPASDLRLASRGQRFAAAMIDGLISFAAVVVAALLSGQSLTAGQYSPPIVIAIGVVGAVNLWTVYRWRASIGKLALGIRMVRSDGSEAELWRLVFLRGLPQWVVSSIPVLNMLILVDVLFIFGKAHRCVHDYIADTIVLRKA